MFDGTTLQINNITVIGANGTMGSLVSGIMASFGDAKVYLASRNKEDSEKVIEKIKKSVRSDSIENNLIPIGYTELKKAIEKSDWIFESIVEDYEIKSKIYKEINEYNLEGKVISTGTSGLSINKLSQNFSKKYRENFIGTHFFNPPYSLNLCELIPSENTNKKLIKEMETYLTNVLNRKTVLIKDIPAFLANRIGFKFLNETLQLAEKHKEKGGIDYIDNLFSGYTGRSMQPLKTIDFVGLDIHKAIVDNIYANTNDEFKRSFSCPYFVDNLIDGGCLGNKTEKGMYRTVNINGKIEEQVYDIQTRDYRKVKEFENSKIKSMKQLIKIGEYEKAYEMLVNDTTNDFEIVKGLLIKYIVYSLIISEKYAENINDCDKAMEAGFNWCPPIALKKLFEKNITFETLVECYIDSDTIYNYNIFDLLKRTKNKYDYRKYIKAI